MKGGDFMERKDALQPVYASQETVQGNFNDPRFPKVVGRTDPILRGLEEMTMAGPGRDVIKG